MIIIFVNRFLDRGFGGNHNLNVVAGHKFDVVKGKNIGRIGHGHNQGRSGAINRNHLVLLGHFRGNRRNDRRVDFKFA